MNVCFLLGGFTVNGGIGRVTSILSNELIKDKDYKIFTLSYYNTYKENLYELDPLINQSFLFERKTNMTSGILKGGIFKLKKYLKTNKIDILVACGALYFPIAVLASKGMKTKCICWEHSNINTNTGYRHQRFARKFVKGADCTVTLTKKDESNYLTRFPGIQVKQIYNPMDSKIFDFKKDYNVKSNKIVSVGRLTPSKNFELLIEIASLILTKYPDWSWDIFGEGELREVLEHKINEKGLQDKITLKGQVNNLYSLYNEYSFMVMTSLVEGFPMTLLEGMGNGLPLVSFDIETGPNEIIENNINGFLIEPFDQEKMEEQIETLIQSVSVRQKFSDRGIALSKNFGLESIVNEWKELFVKV